VKRFFLKFSILAAMLLGLPLGGVALKGLPVPQYLEFPPETRYVSHAPFSWVAFVVYGLLIFAVFFPLGIRGIRAARQKKVTKSKSSYFPWWGWLGIVIGIIVWTLAWTRFPWFARLQPHTFTPLWLSFILAINGLAYRRNGHCMMIDRPGFFLLLFPTSAVFWWFFEYLNRFVQNWHYTGFTFSSWEYFWYATLPYSTVLPAVLSTREWLLSCPWLQHAFQDFLHFEVHRARVVAWVVLLASGAGLGGIGVWPNHLFPLLWISPLIIIVSLQTLMGERHIFWDIAQGEWRVLVFSALAGLFCGWFWEMWNYYSLARWEYAVPFVQRYQIFEMPILGYAGYLPFGLECAVIADMLERVRAGTR
jgi:hypothetical protein